MLSEQPVINDDARMDKIFQQLLDLYERHTQERQLLLREKEELGNLVNLLIGQTKAIAKFEQSIRDGIQTSIDEASVKALHSIEHAVIEKSRDAVDRALSNIDERMASMQALVDTLQKHKSYQSWITVITAVVCGVLASVIMMMLLMH